MPHVQVQAMAPAAPRVPPPALPPSSDALMSTKPALPHWIRLASVEGYLTAHALLPDEPRLFGTESLYGDWGGRVLLLAKDFAPSKVLADRLAEGDTRPYRHEAGLRTNVRLERLAGPLVRGPHPETCGLLYGSALANLLRDDGIWSGALPNRRAALAYGVRVLRFVQEQMPQLEAIVCMGREAWEVTANAFGSDTPWHEMRLSSQFKRLGPVTVVVVPHPAARISNDDHERAWQRVAAAI